MNAFKKIHPFALAVAFCSAFLTITVQALSQATERTDMDFQTAMVPSWYASPWIWVLGVAVFLLVIVSLTRENRSEA